MFLEWDFAKGRGECCPFFSKQNLFIWLWPKNQELFDPKKVWNVFLINEGGNAAHFPQNSLRRWSKNREMFEKWSEFKKRGGNAARFAPQTVSVHFIPNFNVFSFAIGHEIYTCLIPNGAGKVLWMKTGENAAHFFKCCFSVHLTLAPNRGILNQIVFLGRILVKN